MLLRFLGTGTSYGVPFVGCDCAVCTSTDARDQRLRASIVVEHGQTRVLIDTGPDVRQQLLRAAIRRVDALLWTHSHNDHIIGLDDIRPLSDKQGYIPGYADEETLSHLQNIFAYAFVSGRDGGFPRVTGHILQPLQTLQIGALRISALPIQHGRREIFAYKLEADGKTLVYATDCSGISSQSREQMRGADVIVFDALRYAKHPAHSSVEEALENVRELQPRRAFFTHIAHDLSHEETNENLPSHVQLAFDGLDIEV